MSPNNKQRKSNLALLYSIAIFIVIFSVYFINKEITTKESTNLLFINTNSSNYGLFIPGPENSYFSTTDPNVKNLISKYLTKQYSSQISEIEKYGYSLIYYYDNTIFIEAQKSFPNDDRSITSFVTKNISNGQMTNNGCVIFTGTGTYRDDKLLMSASSLASGASSLEGVCLYERGNSNSTFINLSPKLSEEETLFRDPTGQKVLSTIKNVNIKKRTFSIDVFSTTKKDSTGYSRYSRRLMVSY